LISTPADGIRVSVCSTGPTIENCHLDLLQDDPVVFDARINPVAEFVDDRTVRLEEIPLTQIQPGDDLEAMAPDADRKGSLPPVANVEIAHSELKDPARPGVVTFEEPVRDQLSVGDFLVNLDRSNAGFVLRDTDVVDTRARSVRVTSGPGTIEGCTFDGSGAGAIYLEQFSFKSGGEYVWAPKAGVPEITIRNNEILNGGLSGAEWGNPPKAAGIWSKAKPSTDEPGRPHRDITIENNTIETLSRKGVQIADAIGATVEGNDIVDPNQLDLPENDYGFYVENADDVTIRENTVRGSAEDIEAFGRASDMDVVTAAENTLTVDGEDRSPEFVEGTQAWRAANRLPSD
jgi:hypothetical protein